VQCLNKPTCDCIYNEKEKYEIDICKSTLSSNSLLKTTLQVYPNAMGDI
jgi:hypothetical protein